MVKSKQNKISAAASILGRLGGLAAGKCKARPSAVARKAVEIRWAKTQAALAR